MNEQLDVSLISLIDGEDFKLSHSEISPDIDPDKLQGYIKSLGKIQKGIMKIQAQQQRDRNRLSLHSETNTYNYHNVFYGSVIETCIFIVVSLFQVRRNKYKLLLEN